MPFVWGDAATGEGFSVRGRVAPFPFPAREGVPMSNQTHYFRARVDKFVVGMEDTCIVAVPAESKSEAVGEVAEQHLDNREFYNFTEEIWEGQTDRDYRPSTGPVHYLGTHEELMDDGPIMLSDVEGEKVTEEDL